MSKKYSLSNNNRGLTLIELLVSLAILVVVLSIGYTALNLNNRFANDQLRESSQRSDVSVVMNFLTNDVKFSKSLAVVSAKRLDVVDKDGVTVTYTLGGGFLTRQRSGITQTFDQISDVSFTLPQSNLVSARLYTDTANNRYNDFMVSRFQMAINIPQDNVIGFLREKAVFVFGSNFVFEGSNIYGNINTIYDRGNLLTNDLNGGNFTSVKYLYVKGYVNLDGGSAGLGLKPPSGTDSNGEIHVGGNMTLKSGTREIYGTVYVGGNLYLKDAKIYGTVYVNGDVTLDWTPYIAPKGIIKYNGNLYKPASMTDPDIISKLQKSNPPTIPSVVIPPIPDYTVPTLKSDSWYASHGYVSGGTLADGIKIFATDYSNDSWMSSGTTDKPVIIVSKSNINLTGWRNITGVLYAPNGKITFDGASFSGVAISRDGFYAPHGGSNIYGMDIDDLIKDPNDFPFEVAK